MLSIAFDCDGTLINYDSSLRLEICGVLIGFIKAEDVDVIVWSGGGQQYAEGVLNRILMKFCGSEEEYKYLRSRVKACSKDNQMPDIAFDDQFVGLGKINVNIPPINIRK